MQAANDELDMAIAKRTNSDTTIDLLSAYSQFSESLKVMSERVSKIDDELIENVLQSVIASLTILNDPAKSQEGEELQRARFSERMPGLVFEVGFRKR